MGKLRLESFDRKIVERSSPKKVGELLSALITSNERRQILNRAAAVFLRRRGKSYSEIGKELWLSPATISAICKSMREGEHYASRHVRNKKVKRAGGKLEDRKNKS